MAFEPWDETDPIGTDPAGTLWDDIQQFKRQVRERLIGMFTDWSTATDRLTIRKLFADQVNGLTVRNYNDTIDLFTISADGTYIGRKPYYVHLAMTSYGTPYTFAAGPVVFPGTPAIVLDDQSFRTTNWLCTVPAGLGGTYEINANGSVTNPSTGAATTHTFAFKKNGSIDGSLASITFPAGAANSLYQIFNFTWVVTLAAGDTIEPWVNVGAGGNMYSANLTIKRIK